MPRSLVLGNGTVLATFDEHLQMRDLYFPYVGMEDQTTYAHVHRIGFFVEGKGFSWVSDGSWQITPRYTPETLVGDSLLRNDRLGIEATARDYVHPVQNILVRQFFIRSTDGQRKNVRIFFHHDFHIYGDKQKDTAFYEPYTNTVIHYRQTRYFLVGGQSMNSTECNTGVRGSKYASVLRSMEQLKSCGLCSFSIGKSEYKGLEGTWRDAEDGELGRNPVEQGSVDSTVAIHAAVEPGKDSEVVLWVALGKTLDEVLHLHQFAIEETPERLHRHAHNYWKSWVNKTQHDFGGLSPALIDLYKRSLLLMRTHVDSHGGILAAADNDIMAFNRDTYTYVWPRDGALVSMSFDDAGYEEVTRKFYRFCTQVQLPDGYLLHKYNPDGSLGSSWHPWFRDGESQLPIQEDETALVICAIWRYFQKTNDFEFLQDMYEHFVRKAAQFLCDFREESTGLPLPSYDPWEEHRGIFTYTTACTIAGLHAAAEICHILGHYQHSEIYQTAADQMRQALLFHLYDEGKQCFLKKIKRRNGETTERDFTPDASTMFVWMLGVLPPDDPRVVAAMKNLEDAIRVRTPIGGLARYPNDVYHCVRQPDSAYPGNPWIITTLWLAQWHIARAKTLADLEPARAILDWAHARASSTGILPEQMHPDTGAPISVAPLTWSHATFVQTVLRYAEKERKLGGRH